MARALVSRKSLHSIDCNLKARVARTIIFFGMLVDCSDLSLADIV